METVEMLRDRLRGVLIQASARKKPRKIRMMIETVLLSSNFALSLRPWTTFRRPCWRYKANFLKMVPISHSIKDY